MAKEGFCFAEDVAQQDHLSLDSASYTVAPVDDDRPYRVDIPMRALDDGFHNNLKRMYDHLNVKYTPSKFIYPLSTVASASGHDTNHTKPTPYYIHSSSNHQVPPIRPERQGYATWISQIILLAVGYFWFTTCCFLVKPKTAATQSSNEDESFREYLARIQLSRSFSKKYLLPLLSSVTTCPHEALLNFPAVDCVEYAKRTYRQPHYTATGGVQHVQEKLSKDLIVRLGATVTAVENCDSKVHVSWTEKATSGAASSKSFDHVIMAVTPNVVGAIYEPLRESMAAIPVVSGESVVHRDTTTIPDCGKALEKSSSEKPQSQSQYQTRQTLYICSDSAATESIHELPSSIFVTNFPISNINPDKILHRARLTRVLRTPRSRKLVNGIFDNENNDGDDEKNRYWRNGSDNVWLVGAWCWDGMVLLEGCVVSAMRVADNLGVEVPW